MILACLPLDKYTHEILYFSLIKDNKCSEEEE